MTRRFTLIELLTVLGIICILAAMILPALSRARGKARGVSCINVIRQLGLGTILYQDDFDDYYHPSKWGKAEGVALADNFYYYCFNLMCNTRGGLPTPDEVTGWGEAAWKPWLCPDFSGEDAWEYEWINWDRTRTGDQAPRRRPKSGYQYNASAGYNNQVDKEYGTLGVRSQWLKGGKVKEPGRFVLFLDRCNCTGNGGSWVAWYMIAHEYSCDLEEVQRQYCRHEGRCNIVFADGHVEGVRWSDLQDLSNSGDGDTDKLVMQLGGDGM
ncbi:MAG: prepilin-type N-terminal cleavage/methylation domain-containing protein [Oligosphaeraceae bacterium]